MPNWDRMLDVGNPCNDEEEEILCETCGQQVDEDTTCVSSWCIKAPRHKQYSWSELSEAYIELLDERDALKRKLKQAENRLGSFKMYHPYLGWLESLYERWVNGKKAK